MVFTRFWIFVQSVRKVSLGLPKASGALGRLRKRIPQTLGTLKVGRSSSTWSSKQVTSSPYRFLLMHESAFQRVCNTYMYTDEENTHQGVIRVPLVARFFTREILGTDFRKSWSLCDVPSNVVANEMGYPFSDLESISLGLHPREICTILTQ